MAVVFPGWLAPDCGLHRCHHVSFGTITWDDGGVFSSSRTPWQKYSGLDGVAGSIGLIILLTVSFLPAESARSRAQP